MKKDTKTRPIEQKVSRVSVKPKTVSMSWFDRMQADLDNNKSILNIILGALVIVVAGVLVFNLFSKNHQTQLATDNLGPASQTVNTPQADVAKESLPGNYTVKPDDTLYLIAQKYYGNGFQYPKLVSANKLENANVIEVGQVLRIPATNDPVLANVTPAPDPAKIADNQTTQMNNAPPVATSTQQTEYGTGGPTNQTIWGEKITTDTYTVQEGDWLSKIAGRAYGDVLMFTKIAQANNIPNPNKIEPGTVLKIPRP